MARVFGPRLAESAAEILVFVPPCESSGVDMRDDARGGDPGIAQAETEQHEQHDRGELHRIADVRVYPARHEMPRRVERHRRAAADGDEFLHCGQADDRGDREQLRE